MDTSRFSPVHRRVTTQWYCAFGATPSVYAVVIADGIPEAVSLSANLDSVDGIIEALLPDQRETHLPSPTEYNRVGALDVPSSADVKPFVVGIICILTALWTEQLEVGQLRRGKHQHVEFFANAMRVLGHESPLSRVVNGTTLPPSPRYAF